MSKKYRLNKTDLRSLGITVGLAVVSVVIAQLIQVVPNVDFGQNTEVITVVILGLLKALQKFLNIR